MKKELVYPQAVFETRAQARKAIFEYIVTYYNTKRLHSALNDKSPLTFEAYQREQQQPTMESLAA